MACKVCDHTMQGLGEVRRTGIRWFWCNRCGTIKSEHPTPQPHGSEPDPYSKPMWIDRTASAVDIIKGEPTAADRSQWGMNADLITMCAELYVELEDENAGFQSRHNAREIVERMEALLTGEGSA